MAKRIWNGGTGDWFDAANWTTATTDPSSYPLPGDAVTISSGTVSLPGPQAKDNGTFDADAITLGTPGGPLTVLDATNAILNRYLPITAIGSAAIMAAGVSTLEDSIALNDAGATLLLGSGPNGSEAGDLVLSRGAGVSVPAGGTLDLEGAVTVEAGASFAIPAGAAIVNNAAVTQIGTSEDIEGSLTGTGSWNLRFSTTLTLGGSVSAGQTFDFGGVDGRLRLASPASFAGAITGFGPGDLIDLTTVSATNAAYDAATGTLSLDNGLGTAAVATLAQVQAADGTLVAAPDGSGGTLISYASTLTRTQYEIAGADKAMRSDVVRAGMTVPGTSTPITGAGIKIGIISNSFDAAKPGSADADAAAGYLPETAAGTSAVTVLAEGAASSDDEGRAMAELIHQAAPGAQLLFGTGLGSQSTFASSVNALVNAGCNIIVDDITFADAAAYQVTGVVDAAVSAALAAGVDYFTSAGNFGDAFLEQAFAPQAATLPDGTSADAQVFDNGSAWDRVTVPANIAARLDLQWTAPYEGAGNAGAPDALTFKVFTPAGALVATSKQSKEGVATTDIYAQLASQTAAADYLVSVTLNGGQVQPGAFKLGLASFGTGTGPGGVIDDPQASSGSGNLRGQQLIPGVNTVGATFYGNSAAFGQTPSADKSFSDSGPGTLLYDGNGVPLPAPQSAGKVDFTAPDGVNTPVPALASFYGTSAAAPDAAAVAALMLQANPALTTSQVTALMEQSAISLGEEPSTVQGAGLIQADRAVSLAEQAAVPADAFLTTDTVTGVSGTAAGDAYTGPVAGLSRQYIWASPDGAALAATVGSVFLHGGGGDDALSVSSGSNVLDGGAGSNFLTGATGADGGADTFFVDGRGGGGATWSTVSNFHHGDAVALFGFQDGVSTQPWTALDGAAGYQGATIHSELGGAGTGVNDSVTFAGLSLADAQAKLTTSTGTVGGASYLYIAYTG